jgi:hypothetical protein
VQLLLPLYSSSAFNQFDEHFYDEVMGEYITMTLSDDEGEDDYYNKEISMDELEGAVSRLKIDSVYYLVE